VLRRRIEKLEATLPRSAGKLMERLDRQVMNALSARDRELVRETVRIAGRRRSPRSAEHCAADARYLETLGMLLQEVSDEELANLIAQVESELGHPIPDLEAIA
jgi:hypothetical protein